jgi:hypothetical protein
LAVLGFELRALLSDIPAQKERKEARKERKEGGKE